MVIVKNSWAERLVANALACSTQNGKEAIWSYAAKVAAERRLENSSSRKGWTRGKTMLHNSGFPTSLALYPEYVRIVNQPGLTNKDREAIQDAVGRAASKFLAR